jgi:hypothetical protein
MSTTSMTTPGSTGQPTVATDATRRAALFGIMAAGLAAGSASALTGSPASPGPASATVPSGLGTGLAGADPNPDAALFRLVEQCIEAHHESNRWMKFRRREDAKHGLAHPKEMRPATWQNLEGGKFTPTAAARARADEIVAAHDRWEGPEPTSRAYQAAEGKMIRATERMSRLQNRLARTPARTVAGLQAKARAYHTTTWGDTKDIHDHDARVVTSIVRDLLALEGGVS